MNHLLSLTLWSIAGITQSSDPLGIADDCPRIRRPWHELTQDERDLYISGLLQVRANGGGDIDTDDFIAIASVHEDVFAPVTHKASNYLFWHGYFVWELENRIRALGGKYSCFGMPYWDFTMEAGRETDPLIFHTGLGGNGNPDDSYAVNGYSWRHSTEEYWIPFNCLAQNDAYPVCSLKRALRTNFDIPTAQEMGKGIINNPDFTGFAKWYATGYNPVHLYTGIDFLNSPNPVITSYDPIWYLFHSMVQYHQAIWTDCNEYDLVDPDELDDAPLAYKPYCIHGECVSPSKFPAEWMGMGLDDAMHFGGILQDKEWSYIHDHDLTVRKLYHLPRWGIVYDLGNEEGFYAKSGLKEYCQGKLNDKWFITNTDNPYAPQNDELFASAVHGSDSYLTFNSALILIGALVLVVVYSLYYVAKKQSKKIGINGGVNGVYGAVEYF